MDLVTTRVERRGIVELDNKDEQEETRLEARRHDRESVTM